MSDNIMYFEPQEPILTKEDFTKELLIFKQKEQNDLFIIREGMSPVVELNSKKYRCALEHPRIIQTKNPVVTALTFIPRTYGYKFVYFYPVEDNQI